MNKLAIVVSHPIQYYAPLFRTLAVEIELKVFYCYNPKAEEVGKEGFGKAFEWDVDLLGGYDHEFLENRSPQPSLSDFSGCDTPQVGSRLNNYGATHVVVFGWYLKSFIQTRKYCNKNNIPIAVRGDSQLDPTQVWYKRLIKKLYYPHYLNKFDAFLSVGKRNREYLTYYGISEEKIIFSPHAVDQEFWLGEKKAPVNYTFIWVAKFISKKRPLDVIKAFQKITESMPDAELRLVGSGELLEQAKLEASGNKRIKFLGFKNQTELREEYLQADTLILSSDFGETWGLVVNEAFTNGLNAIVSDACGCADDLINENTGIVYPYGNIDKLSESMKKLIRLKKDKVFEKNKINEIAKMNKRYSYQRNIQSFEEFINNV